jgi:hypothetical protein
MVGLVMRTCGCLLSTDGPTRFGHAVAIIADHGC